MPNSRAFGLKLWVAFVLFAGAGLAAAADSAVGPVMPGWDQCRWNDLRHQTPKYAVGRILSAFPHTPNGLKAALPAINALYPGSRIPPEYKDGDRVEIPCVGIIDLVVGAAGDDVGTGWAWQVNEDYCGRCSPNKCLEIADSPCGGGSVSSGSRTAPAPTRTRTGGTGSRTVSKPAPAPAPRAAPRSSTACAPPDASAVARQVVDEVGYKALQRTCRNGNDWTYMDALLDELRSRPGGERWGYWCRRGNCDDASHDVLAYYCGQGDPVEGSSNAVGVDFIINACYNQGDIENPSIGWGDVFGSSGQRAWTGRGRF